MQGEQSTETSEQRLGTAWGRVGTAISGLTEQAKYRDATNFEARVATFEEVLAELRKTPGYSPDAPSQRCGG